ncbi:hypothetical protein M407DRAFT_241205 [Tulasnella calospora MUT 4182]|uniref:Methyltransferase domain-containing protein n=1 Tax=Tulasnella calospora MUT 4182 TaxID=1051891 RepID=A0A0C3QVZ5_9AGAM|nr:hypothetical protein M407DRAFT_241205 [Tulasnella calospora MUT 4182]
MSAPDVDDSVSMTSLDSEEQSRMEKHLVTQTVHGRVLNNTNEKYMLPADTEEHGRLDIQHEMLKAALGGLYTRPAAPAVRRALSSRKDDGSPMVLDIGTGSGSWVVDMARQYPHAEVIGMDLAPPNFAVAPPPNVRIECDDANLGLSQYFPESFDVVHCRCITTGIINYRTLLEQIYAALRPGGVLLTVDCDMLVYSEKQEPILALNENEEGFTWMNKILVSAFEAISARNPNAKAYLQTSKWLKEMEEAGCQWEERGEKAVWVPLGTWPEELNKEPVNKRAHLAAELMREDFYRMGATLRPLLLMSGHFEETVDRWIRMQEAELRDLKEKMYVKWIVNWAVKKKPSGSPEPDVQKSGPPAMES